MKRVLAVTIALAMIFCMAACGKEEAPAYVDTRQGYENLQLSLGSGLPNITMWGVYYLNEIGDSFAADGMVASYYTDLSSEPDYDFYQWEKGDLALEDVVTKKVSKRSSLEQVADYYKFDCWETEGDYEFYNYAVYAEYEGKAYIVQCYYFEEESSYIAVDRWNELKAVDTGVADFTMQVPAFYQEASYNSSTPKNLVGAYYDPDQKMPMVYIYNDETDLSVDEYLAEFAKEHDVITSSKLTYTAAGGDVYPGGYIKYSEQDGENTYTEYTYFISLEGRMLRLNFLTFDSSFMASIEVPAFYNALTAK